MKLGELGVPEAHARRILASAWRDQSDDFRDVKGVPARLLQIVQDAFSMERLMVVESVEDPADGFVKHLFRSPHGALHEAVWIPLLRPDAATVCLSSQVGCSLDCGFCATGRLGLRRNLRPWEMIDAFRQVRHLSKRRLTGAVFMGQGEPFLNQDAVLAVAEHLRHPCGPGISGKAITVSTAGIVPAMRRFTEGQYPYRLIVSLTSAVEEKRRVLMPRVAVWPLEELAEAIRAHARSIGERVTVAWVLLAGVNTGPDELQALEQVFRDVPLRLNLIEVNDPTGRYRPPDEGELDPFFTGLRALKLPWTRRYTGGKSTEAACGMLASRVWSGGLGGVG